MGMIYKRGKTYWIKYYQNGKPLYESSKSKKESEARNLLKKREGEISVGRLAETVNMKPQAVSNQLQRLLDKGILTARRSGNNISYQILDACVVALLDYGLCILEASGELESESTGVYASDS